MPDLFHHWGIGTWRCTKQQFDWYTVHFVVCRTCLSTCLTSDSWVNEDVESVGKCWKVIIFPAPRHFALGSSLQSPALISPPLYSRHSSSHRWSPAWLVWPISRRSRSPGLILTAIDCPLIYWFQVYTVYECIWAIKYIKILRKSLHLFWNVGPSWNISWH